jgi:hypothetical protein
VSCIIHINQSHNINIARGRLTVYSISIELILARDRTSANSCFSSCSVNFSSILIFKFQQNSSRHFAFASAAALAFALGTTIVLCDASVANKDEQKRTTEQVDYKKVRKEIEDILDSETWDDGSYAPLFVRLAWHCSGSYSKEKNDGGQP